tara:strand:- start:104 stop:499 length:396 start_codon:yes stop_codon:yes gene_type:complete
MESPLIIFVILVVLAVTLGGLVLCRSVRRKIAGATKKQLLQQWYALDTIDDTARRVLEADSILNKALDVLGYEGSLGEKLKKAGPRFSDLNAVWVAHKLRNRIAHEPGMQISQRESDQAVARLRRAFDDLC